jgi:hypothetical protein
VRIAGCVRLAIDIVATSDLFLPFVHFRPLVVLVVAIHFHTSLLLEEEAEDVTMKITGELPLCRDKIQQILDSPIPYSKELGENEAELCKVSGVRSHINAL